MGLTENQKRMIEAVCKNDITAARTCAIACLAEDTTAKNQVWIARHKAILNNDAKALEVPPNLVGILTMEDVSENFRVDRYYLSEREAKAADRIIRMADACGKLDAIGIPYLNATLLCGESGTGKTLFGRYMANRMGLPFCYVDFSGLIDSLMGATAKKTASVVPFRGAEPLRSVSG